MNARKRLAAAARPTTSSSAPRRPSKGVKTGAKTGVEGVKAAGSAVGGFVEGGSDEASERWRAGKEKTRTTAREGADDTSAAAHDTDCD